MDVRAQIGDIRMLRRIVALLFALADVAESVADRSLPVRWLVLTILKWAEPVARDFVARETGVVLPELEDMSPGGNGPADALLLAAQFRVMALALDALMSLECLYGREARQHRTVRPDATGLRPRSCRICPDRRAARDPPSPPRVTSRAAGEAHSDLKNRMATSPRGAPGVARRRENAARASQKRKTAFFVGCRGLTWTGPSLPRAVAQRSGGRRRRAG